MADDQFDSPWKEAFEIYLRSLLEFFFPQVAAAIDWTVPVGFLDKELQEVVRDAALGEQRVDKLIQVKLLAGGHGLILIHVEVQNQPEANLPLRAYQYHHRLSDRFGKRVLTLVVLADERPDWRPNHYEEEILGCRVQFDFPICKLLDLVPQAQQAANAGQPSAVMVLANWAAQQTRGDMERRLRLKWDLTRRLYDSGLGRKDILELYRLIDWLLALPKSLEADFKQQVKTYEQSKVMPYVTSIERLAKEEGRSEGRAEGRSEGRAEGRSEGRAEGRSEGRAEGRNEGRAEGMAETILRLLRRRWPSLEPVHEQRIRCLSIQKLEELSEALLDFNSPADLETWLAGV